jgi:hypothetical protein
MTPRQLALHWFLWGQVREGLIEDQRMAPARADEFRHVLYRKACGADLSVSGTKWRSITNAQFDKIKAVFLAYIAPADLLAQIEQEEQPDRRKALISANAEQLFREVGGRFEPGLFAPAIDRYLVRRVFGNTASWERLTDQDCAIVVGILYRRKKQLARKEQRALESNVPF